MQENISKYKSVLETKKVVKKLLIKGESHKECTELVNTLLREIPTNSIKEDILLEKYVFSYWQLNRLRLVTKNLLNAQNEITEDERRDGFFNGRRQRIRDIKRINFSNLEVQKVFELQKELEKTMEKTWDKLMKLQRSRMNTSTKMVGI
jgi:transcription termination factor NusB